MDIVLTVGSVTIYTPRNGGRNTARAYWRIGKQTISLHVEKKCGSNFMGYGRENTMLVFVTKKGFVQFANSRVNEPYMWITTT